MENFFYLPDGKIHFFRNEAQPIDRSQVTSKLQVLDKLFSVFYSIVPNPDIRLRSEGVKVYDKTLADPVVRGCKLTVESSINALEFEITKNDASTQEVGILEEVFNKLFEQDIKKQILLAMLYGTQFMEVVWEKGKYLLPTQLISHPYECFFYKKNPETRQMELRVLTDNNTIEGELVPEYKMLAPTFEGNVRNPYGTGLLSSCYKSIYIKDNAWNFWSIFVEDHGQPKLDAEITKELVQFFTETLKIKEEAILKTVHNELVELRQNGVLTHFQGLNVKPLDTGGSDKGITHRDLMNYSDAQVAILLLGHNGGAQSTPGKLGNENMALFTVNNRVNDYAAFIQNTCNKLIRWIHTLNFPGAMSPQIRLYEKADVAKYQAKVGVDKELTAMGVQFNEDYYQDEYNIDKKYFTLAKPPQPPVTPPTGSPAPKAGEKVFDLHAQADLLAAKLDPDGEEVIKTLAELSDHVIEYDEYKKANESIMKSIHDYIQGCDSYEAMLHGLYDIYSDLPADKLKAILTRMILVSKIYGDSQEGDDA